MGRILSIDYGLKRTGIAVTDELCLIASPLQTVETNQLLVFLKNYVSKENVETIVIGLPLSLDGTATSITGDVKNLHQHLTKIFIDKTIILHDERFTSKMALDAMIAGGSKKKDRRKKENIDKVSACIILQSYLNSKQSI
jgi:putative Holliday junction resolvase